MSNFDEQFDAWMTKMIREEKNPRRRERLEKGLGHGTMTFLRDLWFPAVGNFDHLYPEWEVRDFHKGYRYIDLAYIPGKAKGAIEIQGYGPHARDLDVRRFKDLCRRHCLLALDGWLLLPIAYPSMIEEPEECRHIILSFIGRFVAQSATSELSYVEAETIRLAHRLLRPFSPLELAAHLRVSDKHARKVLRTMTSKQLLAVASGRERARFYRLPH
ncbi:hypothetical protein [Paenibacillus daejeonensis]|uniref:hypothetical protein n=1 Tax=Paenibacillus daejeonensis TaxID=135193 RepID=UPI000376B4B7|nr:hypothetical protein [Paenibacillus daejeonensis]